MAFPMKPPMAPMAGKMAAPFPPKKKKKAKPVVDSAAEDAAETPRSMMAAGLTRKAPMKPGY